MPLSLRARSALAALAVVLVLPEGSRAGAPPLPKPTRLGRPAPAPNLPGLYNLPSVAFSRDGKRLAWVYGESTREDERGFTVEGRLIIEVWDVPKRKLLQQMRPGDDLAWACSRVSFTPDGGRVVLGTWKGVRVDVNGRPGSYLVNKVRVWDVDGEREVGELPAADGSSNEAPHAFFIHPRGDRLTVMDVNTLRVLEFASGKTVKAQKLSKFGGAAVFSPDGKFVAALTAKAELHIWRVEDGKELRRMPGMPLAFSPNGKVLASQHDGKILLSEVASGQPERTFTGQVPWPARAFCFSPDGKLLAWNDTGKLTVADRATGRVLANVQTQPGALAFSPDGSVLALACPDSTALLWDVRALRKAK